MRVWFSLVYAGYWYWLLTAGEFEYSNMTKGIADWRTRVKHR